MLATFALGAALIEERELGGTCLNRGCIPTKALVESARTALREADEKLKQLLKPGSGT